MAWEAVVGGPLARRFGGLALPVTLWLAAAPLLGPAPAAAVYESEEPEGAPIPPAPTPPAPTPLAPPAPDDPEEPAPEDPDTDPDEPQPPAPTPEPLPEDEDGPFEPAPEPTPEAPPVDPGGGTGERDGEPFEIDVRPAPRPDDPVLERVPGLTVDEDEDGTRRLRGLPLHEDGPPREARTDQVVVVDAGPLALVLVGETCAGEVTDLDASGALRTTHGGTTVAVADGVIPDSEVAKWLYSDPKRIGSDVVRDGTRAELLGRVPDDQPLGRHTIQVTATGTDAAAYHLSLDVLVEDCDAGPVSGLLGAGLPGLLFAAALFGGLLGAGWIILGFRRITRIELGSHLGGETVPATAGALPQPVATLGRREIRTERRGGPADLDRRDRGLQATELRRSGGDILDLDLVPVPLASVTVIEAGDVTWVFAARRPMGGFLPIGIDGLPTLVPGATLVVAVDGVRRGTRAEFRLGPLPGEEDLDEALEPLVLARLRADSSGRVRGEVPLPDDLGGLPVRLGLRARAT